MPTSNCYHRIVHSYLYVWQFTTVLVEYELLGKHYQHSLDNYHYVSNLFKLFVCDQWRKTVAYHGNQTETKGIEVAPKEALTHL